MAQQLPFSVGATLYRLAFAIFVIACLFNAYDAFITYTQANYNLISGVDTRDKINETIAYLGLSFLLMLEGVSLLLYKRVRNEIAKVL